MKSKAACRRGAAAVARLGDMPPLEAAAIVYLRLAGPSEAARRRIREDLFNLVGAKRGAEAETALAALVALLDDRGRRPLLRHAPSCGCVGADEAAFAHLVAAAAEGAREDAILLASLLLPPDCAFAAYGPAQTFGVALRRLTASIAAEWTVRGASTVH